MIPQERSPGDEFATASLGMFRSTVDALETSVRGIRTVWDGLLVAVEQFFEAIRRKLDDSWWGQVVEWFTEDVSDVLVAIERIVAEARTKISEILAKLEQTISGALPVGSLFMVGLDWSTKVNSNLSRIVPDVKQSGGIDSWHGPAHNTYLTRELEQEQAAGLASEATKELSVWLSEVGVANVQFIGKLLDQAGLVIEKVVEVTADLGVVATTGDPLSGQEAVNDLASTLGRFASNIVSFLTALGTRLAEVVGMITKVAAEHSDYRAFPGSHWPPAVQA